MSNYAFKYDVLILRSNEKHSKAIYNYHYEHFFDVVPTANFQ